MTPEGLCMPLAPSAVVFEVLVPPQLRQHAIPDTTVAEPRHNTAAPVETINDILVSSASQEKQEHNDRPRHIAMSSGD